MNRAQICLAASTFVALAFRSVAAASPGSAAVADLIGPPDPGERVYRKVCYICHDQGIRISEAVGAPRLGNVEAWESRKPKGEDGLYQGVVNPAPEQFRMPVGALSEYEVRSAIRYMLRQVEERFEIVVE